MTTAKEPQERASALTRGWRAYRRWRHARPYWGGKFMILSAAEIWAIMQPDVFSLGYLGKAAFLPNFIAALLLVCGLLTWFLPAQRAFYGVVASLCAVASLLYANLGGFLVGAVFGLVGGSLAFAWTPRAAADAPPAAEPAQDGPATTADDTTLHEMLDVDPNTDTVTFPAIRPEGPRHAAPSESETGNGWPYWNPPAEEPPLPRRESTWRDPKTMLAIATVPLLLAAGLFISGGGGRAVAAPPAGCPTAAPTATGTPAPTSPAPSGGDSRADGNPVVDAITGFFDGLFGGKKKAAQEEPAPSATPSPTGSPTPKPCPSQPPGTQPGGQQPGQPGPQQPGAKADEPVDPNVPPVHNPPSRLTAGVLTQFGLKFDGVFRVPVADGSTIRVLRFSFDKAVNDNFELQSPITTVGKTLSQKSNQLTVEGHVKFYAVKFSGRLLGIPLTFTPDFPPPLVLPFMIFTDAKIDLAFVKCDLLTAKVLTERYL